MQPPTLHMCCERLTYTLRNRGVMLTRKSRCSIRIASKFSVLTTMVAKDTPHCCWFDPIEMVPMTFASKISVRDPGHLHSKSSRDKPFGHAGSPNANGRPCGRPFGLNHRDEVSSVLGRPGSDLLFQVLRLSTIGAGEFNGRVRNGIGYRLPAVTTRPAKDG